MRAKESKLTNQSYRYEYSITVSFSLRSHHVSISMAVAPQQGTTNESIKMASHESSCKRRSSSNSVHSTQGIVDSNGAERSENEGAATPRHSHVQQDLSRLSQQLDSAALESMTHSWWESEDDGEEGIDEESLLPYGQVGGGGGGAAASEGLSQQVTGGQGPQGNERISPLAVESGHQDIDDDDPSLCPPVASLPQRNGDEKDSYRLARQTDWSSGDNADSALHPPVASVPEGDGDKKYAYRLPRRTVPAGPNLLSPSFDKSENETQPSVLQRQSDTDGIAMQPSLTMRRQSNDDDIRPGAIAMQGRGVGPMPACANVNHHQRRNESPRRHRHVLSDLNYSFRRQTSGSVVSAEIAQASAVDNAEPVVYATSINPDRTATNRRIVIGLGIVAVLLILGLSVGLIRTWDEEVVESIPSKSETERKHPWCEQQLEEQDVFAHCLCSNTTSELEWTQTEKRYYHMLQRVFINNSVIDTEQEMDSCATQNQCMVWTANYERRNMTKAEFEVALENTDPVIQYYALCMTYIQFDGWNWTQHDGWLKDKFFCDWFGMQCSFLSRVTGIKLPSNGLNGTFPSELGRMAFLSE